MSKNAIISLSLVAGFAVLAGLILLSGRSQDKTTDSTVPSNNVSVVEGRQVVAIDAKGGYSPRKSVATAGLPTVITFNTGRTFDCSTVVRIPSLDITKNLPNTGATEIDIGVQPAGTFKGSCGMGMYPFEINFVPGGE